jgi:hypothetical protein
MSNTEVENLPAEIDADFSAGSDGVDRTIQGVIIKCVDGRWVDRDGHEFPAGTKMLALGSTEVLQHFENGKLIEEIKKNPFPDVQALNDAIPRNQWSEGINGPRPPWSHQYVCYLLDPSDGAIYTCINNTVGQEIAVRRLTEKVKWGRRLRGPNVRPLVLLDHRPMPTRHGAVKQRPEWTVVDWRDLSGGELVSEPVPQLVPAQAPMQIGKPVKPITSQEVIDDEIPF